MGSRRQSNAKSSEKKQSVQDAMLTVPDTAELAAQPTTPNNEVSIQKGADIVKSCKKVDIACCQEIIISSFLLFLQHL